MKAHIYFKFKVEGKGKDKWADLEVWFDSMVMSKDSVQALAQGKIYTYCRQDYISALFMGELDFDNSND